MDEFACIRILFEAPANERDTDHLRALIGKFTESFLEQRWRLPRRFEGLAPTCFLLIDPVSRTRDFKELSELANDLQMRLFGSSGAGQVQLFALWGSLEEIAEFNSFSDAALEALAANPGQHWIAGRLVRFGSDTATTSNVGSQSAAATTPLRAGAPAAYPLQGLAEPTTGAARRPPEPPARPAPANPPKSSPNAEPSQTAFQPSFRGVYFTPKETLFGSVVAPALDRAGRSLNLLDTWRAPPGLDPLELDHLALKTALHALSREVPGVAYVPLSFATVITRMRFERLRGELERLTAYPRNRLAATLYGVPPSPPSESLSLAFEALRGAFGVVDLQAPTPDFMIPGLVANCVRSLTFTSQAKASARRMAEMETFLARMPEFKAAKLWVVVGQVQTAEELALCLRLGAPFVYGPAVSDVTARPFNLDAIAAQRLPRRAA